ncbi:hypothetical protein ACLOJK_035044 [Asimina triloba]
MVGDAWHRICLLPARLIAADKDDGFTIDVVGRPAGGRGTEYAFVLPIFKDDADLFAYICSPDFICGGRVWIASHLVMTHWMDLLLPLKTMDRRGRSLIYCHRFEVDRTEDAMEMIGGAGQLLLSANRWVAGMGDEEG